MRTTDGELFEYPGPVSVKDLMYGFQGFAVFHNYAGVKHPLHPETQLKLSEIYYLKPWTKPSINQLHDDHEVGKLMGSDSTLSLAEDLISGNDQERTTAQGPKESIKEVKVKKVRFSDEVVLISSANQLINPVSNEDNRSLKVQNEELSHNQNGVVRLKVVISKKQFTELMSPRTPDKEADALMEKMIAPLLSPNSSINKSDSYGLLSPTWRPSLEHILEDH